MPIDYIYRFAVFSNDDALMRQINVLFRDKHPTFYTNVLFNEPILSEFAPNVIIIDFNLENAFELTQQLKKSLHFAKCNLIALIPFERLFTLRDQIYAQGIFDYICLPLHLVEAHQRLSHAVKLNCLVEYYSNQQETLRILRNKLIQRSQALEQAQQVVEQCSQQDNLTKLPNRRHFENYLRQEWQRAIRESTPLALIFCDIDHFSEYNYRYGHQAGDECLCQIANAITHVIKRPSDLVARYNDDIFVITLPSTPRSGAGWVAHEILNAVRHLHIEMLDENNQAHTLSISLGVVSWIPQAEQRHEILFRQAKAALSLAKQQGGNQFVLYEDLLLSST